ncbi:MAG TPA: heavy-metal-associated domain-containing protein [Thiobacillus sp.]
MHEFQVAGMGCSSCVNKITQAIHAHDPDAIVNISLDTGRVEVESEDPAQVLGTLITDLGYRIQD